MHSSLYYKMSSYEEHRKVFKRKLAKVFAMYLLRAQPKKVVGLEIPHLPEEWMDEVLDHFEKDVLNTKGWIKPKVIVPGKDSVGNRRKAAIKKAIKDEADKKAATEKKAKREKTRKEKLEKEKSASVGERRVLAKKIAEEDADEPMKVKGEKSPEKPVE